MFITGLAKCIARAVCGATHVTTVALFCGSSLLCSSNCVSAAQYEAGQSVSANGNEESTGENCHWYISAVNAITLYSYTIKLQYILLGDYWEWVRPARLTVLTFKIRSSSGPQRIQWCLSSLLRPRLKCDGTCAETRFLLSAKRTSPFKSAGASVQSTTGSRVVRISGSNVGYTMFRDSVKGTGYPLHSPVSPSIPLPCVTVCHHISTGL